MKFQLPALKLPKIPTNISRGGTKEELDEKADAQSMSQSAGEEEDDADTPRSR